MASNSSWLYTRDMNDGNNPAPNFHAQVTDAITGWLRADSQVSDLVRFLKDSFAETHGVFVVGGALRDLFLSPPRPRRDVDVVLGGVTPESIRAIKGSNVNFFGGTTLLFGGLAVDVWPLEDTYHIREFHLPKTIAGFLTGAPFNLDKIAFNLDSGILHDDGCLAGIASREIAYAPAQAYLEEIQAVRCVLLRRKTAFALADSASALLDRVARRIRRDNTAVLEMKQYLAHFKDFYDESIFDSIVEEILLRPQESHV